MGSLSQESLNSKHNSTMRHLVLCIVLITALLGPAVEAIFLGPIAVGVGLGALAFKKGLILGSVLGQSRTNTRGGRTYTRYNRRSHYSQPNNYYSHYTQPRSYYYSSKRYNTYRGKRDTLDYNEEEMNSVEKEIIEVFGEGSAVDTSKSTAVFDFAAQAGKYWKVGGIGCEFFSRCDTPYADMVAMIENELNDFAELEKSFHGNKKKVASKMSEEHNFIENEIKKMGA